MQLAHPHRGWENEHLATLLLSRLAFISSPITVGDDIGTDIFCTLFETGTHKGQPVLLLRSSIAVQVKSSRDPVDIAPHLDYIARLEVPYYLGIVNQKGHTLELFSARFLPALLSLKGVHSNLFLEPIDDFQREYRPVQNGVYSLLCHKIATLSVHDDANATSQSAAAIRDDSASALRAIASRLNQEYVFEIPGGEVQIFAGPGSAQTFRHAFFKRLYFNLSWLIDGDQAAAEMDVFVSIVDGLASVGPIPKYVLRLREGLQQRRLNRGVT